MRKIAYKASYSRELFRETTNSVKSCRELEEIAYKASDSRELFRETTNSVKSCRKLEEIACKASDSRNILEKNKQLRKVVENSRKSPARRRTQEIF